MKHVFILLRISQYKAEDIKLKPWHACAWQEILRGAQIELQWYCGRQVQSHLVLLLILHVSSYHIGMSLPFHLDNKYTGGSF